MYCGSCLHDNALCKALLKLGHDALLVPIYTPILTDEENVSSNRLFYGGLNVYLQQTMPLLGKLPAWADSFLSSPKLVSWIAERAMGTTAGDLGALTVSMLKGKDGRQRKEVKRLCDWLQTQTPDVIIFSNLLIAGCIPQIKQQIGCKTVVILQGDDIFYDSLKEPFKQQAFQELRRLSEQVDLFIVHSQDYGLRMQHMLRFDNQRLAVNPLTIDTADFLDLDLSVRGDYPPTIGYLARLAPEKGLHLLVDAFIDVQQALPEARLAIAGWLGKQHTAYWQQQQDKLAEAGLAGSYTYYGSVDRSGKLAFLQAIDVLSVPTPYLEPKGLFVLEALAAGVPYVQPAHGAFPELHARLGGGHLFAPESQHDLAQRLLDTLRNLPLARELGQGGRHNVLEGASTMHEAVSLQGILATLI